MGERWSEPQGAAGSASVRKAWRAPPLPSRLPCFLLKLLQRTWKAPRVVEAPRTPEGKAFPDNAHSSRSHCFNPLRCGVGTARGEGQMETQSAREEGKAARERVGDGGERGGGRERHGGEWAAQTHDRREVSEVLAHQRAGRAPPRVHAARPRGAGRGQRRRRDGAAEPAALSVPQRRHRRGGGVAASVAAERRRHARCARTAPPWLMVPWAPGLFRRRGRGSRYVSATVGASALAVASSWYRLVSSPAVTAARGGVGAAGQQRRARRCRRRRPHTSATPAPQRGRGRGGTVDNDAARLSLLMAGDQLWW